MKRNSYIADLEGLTKEPINHGSGVKKVFINNKDTNSALTQFAWSRFDSGDSCSLHSHPSMDEYFFVYKGNGFYEIENEMLAIKEGDFIRIPSNTSHKLIIGENDSFLELIYFGIATDENI